MRIRPEYPAASSRSRIGLLRGITLAALLAVLSASIAVADWPTYRHDPARTGYSDDSVAFPLTLTWQHRALHPPRPAWPAPAYGNLLANVRSLNKWDLSDHASHTVCTGGHVIFGSTVDDSVTCLRLTDGEQLWKFFAEGPVRMPPTLAPDKVYFGADDGNVYCLQAQTGKLVWQKRVGPENRDAPGNGRMISRWPIRSGPLLKEGRVYVGAGVFPLEGVFLASLNAEDGSTCWSRAIDVVMHGPMVASDDQLFVSALRGNPGIFDLAAGKHLGSIPGSGAFTAFSRDKLVSGPNEVGALGGVELEIQQALSVREGFQMVFTGEMLIAASNEALVGFNPQMKPLWKVARSQTHSLIVAGGTAFIGGDGEVVAHEIRTGKSVWQHRIDGKALGLAVADGCLIVSTDRGDVVCFGPQKPTDAPRQSRPLSKSIVGPEVQQQATDLLRHARSRSGYALLIDSGDDRLAAAIASESQLHVVGSLNDPAALQAARLRLSAEGLYGTRLSLRQGPVDVRQFQEQSFNLIVVTCAAGEVPRIPAAQLISLLHPYNGALVVVGSAKTDIVRFDQWRSSSEGWQVEASADGFFAVYLPLPAASYGEWSHPFADPGHSSCSQDDVVRSPFELQWFGPPGPQHIVDRHNRTSPPLFKEGRLFVPGKDRLTAVDAYNGTILWEKEIADSTRLAVSKNCGHVVVGSDEIYVAVRDQCQALRTDTGELAFTFSLPDVQQNPPREWGYLSLAQNVLLGSVSRQEPARKKLSSESWQMGFLDNSSLVTSEALFAYDLATRKLLWNADAGDRAIINTTFAAQGQQVFYVQSGKLDEQSNPTGRMLLPALFAGGAELVCRDLKTGASVWSKPVELSPQHSLFLVATQGLIVLASSRNQGNALICDLVAHDAATGDLVWSATEPTGFKIGGSHGEQEQHPLVVGDTIYFKTFSCKLRTGAVSRDWKLPIGGCGALSASNHATFFRASTSHYADLETGAAQPITGVTRPGCWLNMVPAGGLLLAPESSAGCTCQYPIQSSLAMRPLACPPPTVAFRAAPTSEKQPFAGDIEFAGRIWLELESPSTGYPVHYAFDGQWPTEQTPKYESPLLVDRATILWARGMKGDQRGGLARRRLMLVETPRLRNPATEFVISSRIEFQQFPGDIRIHYQLDGESPDANSTHYQEPFEITEPCKLVAAYFVDDKKTGPDLQVEFHKVPGRKPDSTGELEPGLAYEYFEQDNLIKLPVFTGAKPLHVGSAPRFVVPKEHRPDGFAFRYSGYLHVPIDGMYKFFLKSDDGSELRIGEQIVATNDGIHDARGEAHGQVPLAAGKHRIEVRFFDAAAGEWLWVAYEGPGIGKREIPAEALWQDRQPSPSPKP